MTPSTHDSLPMRDDSVRDDEVDLISVAVELWARRGLIAAITLSITALAVLYTQLATPTYEAVAELRPQTASALSVLAENDLLSVTPQTAFDRTLLELQSSATQLLALSQVLDDEERAAPEEHFSISSVTERRVVGTASTEIYLRATVYAQHSNAQKSAALANTLSELASQAAAAAMVDEIQSTAAARIKALEKDIERRRNAARRDTDIRISLLLEADTITRNTLEDKIRVLRATARKLREDEIVRLQEALDIALELHIAEPKNQEFQNIINIDTLSTATRSDRSANPPLYVLGSRWLQAEISALQARQSDDHNMPEIRVLQQQLGELEVNEEIEVLKRREDFTAFIPDISELLSEMSRLEAFVRSEFTDIMPARLDSRALPPRYAVAPRRGLILALALIGGSLAGVVAALLLNAARTRQPAV